MDADAKKIALRMIPYGIYVMTAEAPDGRVAGATVNWVTQVSFQPPLVVVGVKTDSTAHPLIKETRRFALNVLGKGRQDVAFKFFKPAVREGDTLSGERVERGQNGSPLMTCAAATLELTLVDTVERGDHSVFVGEVTAARVLTPPAGRPDDAVLLMRELGDKIFYGG